MQLTISDDRAITAARTFTTLHYTTPHHTTPHHTTPHHTTPHHTTPQPGALTTTIKIATYKVTILLNF